MLEYAILYLSTFCSSRELASHTTQKESSVMA